MIELNHESMQVVHICAKNDKNGNPRRLYLLIHDKGIVAIDEGYTGYSVLGEYLKKQGVYNYFNGLELLRIEVPTSEYKRLLKKYPI